MAEAGQEVAATAAATTTETDTAAAEGWQAQLRQLLGEQPLRRIGLVAGLVAAVAVGIGLFVWAQEPNYRPLYSRLSQQDAAEVVEALKAGNIPYRLDANTGAILVPAAQVHEVRLGLASQGLPRGEGVGYELLQRDQGFGTSQFMENARFNRALEAELARSISALNGVESARVHLAIPKQSVFIRERNQPSASVLVNLRPGRGLGESQVAAIVHMVASSVPGLEHDKVTVVDQRGRLLTRKEDNLLDATAQQLDYKQQLEDAYVRRIEALLTPMLGPGGVRAQVDARLEFGVEESTQELFDPAGIAVRSEQLSEQQKEDRPVGGVPGALTNQPPQAGTLAPGEPLDDAESRLVESSRNQTRNFEVSKTIRHSRRPLGVIQRLSVAVLVDEKDAVDEEGNPIRQPLSQEELDRISSLVQQAVGFDAERGDTISVISAPFQGQDSTERTPLLEQPWVWETGRLLLAALLALALLVFVVRPLLRNLFGPKQPEELEEDPELEQLPGAEEPLQLPGPEGENPLLAGVPAPVSYEDALTAARQLVSQEPAVAANVVKDWLAEDEQ